MLCHRRLFARTMVSRRRIVELMLRQDVEWAFFSSDDDCCYGGDFDAENHLGKAEESKFF